MDERKYNWQDLFKVGTPLCGMTMGVLGALTALMLIFLGFWKTVFIVLLAVIGYGFGAYTDKAEKLKAVINRIFPAKGE